MATSHKRLSSQENISLRMFTGQVPGDDDISPLLQGGCHMICFKLDDEQERLLRDWQENHECKYRL